MRAVLCSAFTGPEDLRIGEIEEPKPAGDEILIDVHAASVSFMDHLLVSGRYQMRPPTPFVPGTEAAGVVIAVGGKITRFRPGDRVAAVGWTGGYAERMIAKEWKSVRLPAGVAFETAAAVWHTYGTAYYALVEGARAQHGETLLVTGAAGGVASPPSTSPAIWACASSPVSAPTTRQAWCAVTVRATSSTIGAKTCASGSSRYQVEKASILASTMSAERFSSKWRG
jgi:D-arabinose 1-dehydrogenase-like Zn-dependent alcohol dehydrogenase